MKERKRKEKCFEFHSETWRELREIWARKLQREKERDVLCFIEKEGERGTCI